MSDKIDENKPQMVPEEDPVEVAYQQWKDYIENTPIQEQERRYIELLKKLYGNDWESHYVK